MTLYDQRLQKEIVTQNLKKIKNIYIKENLKSIELGVSNKLWKDMGLILVDSPCESKVHSALKIKVLTMEAQDLTSFFKIKNV